LFHLSDAITEIASQGRRDAWMAVAKSRTDRERPHRRPCCKSRILQLWNPNGGTAAMKNVLMLAGFGLLLAALSPAVAEEKVRASDKAALAECLKYVSDFPGEVPGVNDTPTPAIHIDNAIKLAGHEPASCINYVTELCSFESDDGQSQLGLIDCANREVGVWEDRLNMTYEALIAKAAPKAREGYRKMQRAWIAYRDARCAAEASAETVNTDRQSNIIVSCALDATARQALILDDELSDLK